jgi:hypothetical protein
MTWATIRAWLAARYAATPLGTVSFSAFLGYYGTALSADEQRKVVEALVVLTGVTPENVPAVVALVVAVLGFLSRSK